MALLNVFRILAGYRRTSHLNNNRDRSVALASGVGMFGSTSKYYEDTIAFEFSHLHLLRCDLVARAKELGLIDGLKIGFDFHLKQFYGKHSQEKQIGKGPDKVGNMVPAFRPHVAWDLATNVIINIPKADIGLNATILICYLWVAICLPFTKIQDYLKAFYGLKISTSGLSRHVIRVSAIMKAVYDEILEDINNGITLFADETGWRVRAKNWWLWVFGTQDTAYFTIDKSRGSDVVRRVLGEIFLGLLVVDGWSAYFQVICEQQSCMAHLLRKIRKFRDAFPNLTSIVKFYLKLRRILRDGERLQKIREQIGEEVFERRLKRLKKRLEDLLNWPNPNDILKEIIKKVKRQQPRILTFVEHPGAPCHNNYGEFLIRIGVLKRKISGGSVSAEGANAYAILLSIYVTCKLREISFPKYMKESLRHYIRTGKPMLLSTYSTFIAEASKSKKAA